MTKVNRWILATMILKHVVVILCILGSFKLIKHFTIDHQPQPQCADHHMKNGPVHFNKKTNKLTIECE